MKVVILRGFGGEVFSTGMDRLCEKIHNEFDAECVIDSYDRWYPHYSQIKDSDKKFVLIGHSFGALACYKIVSMLPLKKFPLVVSFDYSPYYSGLVAHPPDGVVPGNVEKAINFYQEVDPLVRGVKMERADGSETNIYNELTNYAHVEIDKVPELHQKVIQEIGRI